MHIHVHIHYITHSVTLGDASGGGGRGVVCLAGRCVVCLAGQAVCKRRGRECVHAVRAGPVPDLGTDLGFTVQGVGLGFRVQGLGLGSMI